MGSVRMADVTDGTSNTFLFGEMSRFLNEMPADGYMVSNVMQWVGDQAYNWPGGSSRITGGAFVVPAPNVGPDTTGSSFLGCFAANVAFPPDWLLNAKVTGGPCNTLGQWGFRSFHPGGLNFAFGDGSVKFIKQSISLITYRALGTRNQGEAVSADQY